MSTVTSRAGRSRARSKEPRLFDSERDCAPVQSRRGFPSAASHVGAVRKAGKLVAVEPRRTAHVDHAIVPVDRAAVPVPVVEVSKSRPVLDVSKVLAVSIECPDCGDTFASAYY